MTTVALNTSNAVTLDADGNGTAQLGPTGGSEVWTVDMVHVKTNQDPGSIVNEAQCTVYAGATVDDSGFVDATGTGSTGDATDAAAAWPISVGAYIWAVWTGGDPGAQGNVRVSGSKDV